MIRRSIPPLALALCLACGPSRQPPAEAAAAERHLAEGRYGEALALLREQLASGDLPRVHAGLGNAHARLGRLDSAAAHYQASLSFDPRRVEVHHNLGVVLADLGRFDEAVAALERALDLDPGFAPSHLTLGLFRSKVGDYKGAEAAFRAASDAGGPSAHRHLGGLYVRLGRYDEADRELEQALKADPRDAESHRLRAVSLRSRGDLEGAAASFSRAVELDPNDHEALFGLANVRIASGDTEGGSRLLERYEQLRQGAGEVEQLRRRLDGRPGDVEARMALAGRLLRDGLEPEAARQYEAVLAYDAGQVEARLRLGRLYRDRGDTLRALQALSAAPVEDARLAFFLGSLQLVHGALEAGAATLERATVLDPGRGEILNNLGNVRLLQGNPEAAAAAFRRALAAASPSAQAALNLGTLWVQAGREDSAAACYRLALRIDPDLAAAHLALARLHDRGGRRGEAAASYERLLAASPDPALREEARVYLRRWRERSGGGWADVTPWTLVALAAALAGCQPEASPGAAGPAEAPPPAGFAVRFVDVAAEVGLDAAHVSGFSEARFFPETMGGGGLLWDYDRDGWLDVYLVNGRPLSPGDDGPPVGNRLFRGLGDGTFAETTAQAGVGHRGYGNGCVAGDLDGDGDDDLYVTNYGADVLFRNDAGAFGDATSAAGLGDPGWGTGCAVLDHDLDGDLDLYVARYVDYELADAGTETVPYLSRSESAGPGGPGYPHPDNFGGLGDLLLRNDGGPGPVFTDVSAAAGVHLAGGKGLGVVTGDVDGDGWTDLYVANDATPNYLFINRRDGTFEERGARSGVAYGESGLPEAGMGVDAADYDGDGRLDLTVTNFQGEPNSLFRNQGDGSYFLPEAYSSGTGAVTVPALAFGTNWVDVDGDGRLDLFAANGHVLDNVRSFDRSTTYRQRNFLFHNRGPGAYGNTLFADVTSIAGPGLAQERVSRGSAAGDLDNDGDADLLVINLGDRVSMLRNEGGNGNGWLSVRLRRASSGSGEGARLRLHSPSGMQWREVSSGRSYLSQSDPRVLFGLGPDSRVDSLEVWWPGGAREVYRDLAAGRFLHLVEDGAR